MNVQGFVEKWDRAALTERSSYQQHFLDLCDVFDQPKPADRAVFAAYSWPDDIPEEEMLARLLALNAGRVA